MLSLTPDEFERFAGRLPRSARAAWADPLPKLTGFRPGNDLDQRIRRFFHRISAWGNADWTLMESLWERWSRETGVFSILGMEVDSDEHSALSTEDGLRQALAQLLEAAENGRLTSELIVEWLTFGPMSTTQDVMNLAYKAPRAAEIEIPRRLTTIETRMTALDREAKRQFEEASKVLHELQLGQKATKESHQRLLNEQIKSEKNALEAVRQIRESVDALRQDAKTLRRDLEALGATAQRSAGQVADVGTELHDLADRLSVLEAQRTAVPNVTVQLDGAGAANQRRVCVEAVAASAGAKLLDRWSDILQRLSENLLGLGLREFPARVLAQEVVGALASGQLVHFTGTMGRTVALSCARTLSDSTTRIALVPVGMLDGEQCRGLLAEWMDLASQAHVTSIIFEGINHSAFDVYAPCIRDFILDRVHAASRMDYGLSLFGIVEPRPAGLPWDRSSLDLGPLFPCDLLGWRTRRRRASTGGNASVKVFEALQDAEPVEWEDLEVPEWLSSLGGPAWQRNVVRAAEACLSVGVNDTFRGLGWFLPMAALVQPDRLSDIIEARGLREAFLNPDQVVRGSALW